MKANIDLDQAQLASVISLAIVKALDEKQKEALIQHALNELTAPQIRYDGKKGASRIEEAFNAAVYTIAVDKARQMVTESDNVKKAIEAVIERAVKRVLEERLEQVVERLAETISKAFQPDRY